MRKVRIVGMAVCVCLVAAAVAFAAALAALIVSAC